MRLPVKWRETDTVMMKLVIMATEVLMISMKMMMVWLMIISSADDSQ